MSDQAGVLFSIYLSAQKPQVADIFSAGSV